MHSCVCQVPPTDPFPESTRGRTLCGIVWCCTGSKQLIDDVLVLARAVAAPLFEGVCEMPYPTLQSSFDASYPAGRHWYWKGDVFRDVPDAAIAEHRRFAEMLPGDDV